MMANQTEGPPVSKRAKLGGGMNPNDNVFNMGVLEDLPDGLLSGAGNNMPPNSNMMSHQPPQQQPPIHETHQNLTALLSNNTPPKDVNHSTSMNNAMVNNYSGPGPGHPPGPSQYHNNMMTNGPSSANYVSSSGYNNAAAVSYAGSTNLMYSNSVPSSNSFSVSNAMPHTLSALSNQPGMNSMQPHQQHSGMVQQGQQPMQQQQQPGMGMMNGPSSVMSNMSNRSLPSNNMNPRLPNPQQTMNNGPMPHPGNGSMVGGPPGPGQQMMTPMNGPARPPGAAQPVNSQTMNAKRKQLQQQLVLLLHAHKCQRRERSNGELEPPCTLMHCKTMKGVLQHMTACAEGKNCQVTHCISSRQIIGHWRGCTKNDCCICLPLKSASERKSSNQGSMLNNLIQNTGGGNALNVNGLDLPGTGPNSGMPQGQMQPHSMAGVGGPGNMPPPTWPPQQAPMSNPPINQQASSGLMPQQQPKPPQLPGQQALPPGSGGAPAPSMSGANNSATISAPEMKKAYDALGLQYPGVSGNGAQHIGALSQQPGQRPPQMAIGSITINTKDQATKEWHKNVAIDLRNHLVHKLVQAIFPSPQPEVLSDPRMTNLIHYARKVEMEMYRTANSREEYYHMLAEKIYKIQKELEEKRRSRRQQIQSLQSQPGQPQQPASNQPQHSNMVPSVNSMSNMNGPGSVQPNSVQSASGPGSVPSYSGPPSAGPHSIASASMMSPPMAVSGSTGVPVSMALQESKNDFEEAIRKRHMQHNVNINNDFKAESKPEVKLEPEMQMETSSAENDQRVKTEVKPEPVVKEEPRAPLTPKAESKDVKDIKPATPSSQKAPVETRVFSADELRQAFIPTLEKLLKLDESLPFRQPVDPIGLNIPDYYDIVKTPMDLASIKNNLDTGAYTDPWQYCDDVWLMFDNAWAYNRKTSRVYKWCSKLAEVFENDIDVVMQNLGFCCGRKYVFSPQTLCCYGKQLCTINRDQVYFSYENRYVFCEKCFEEIHSDMVDLSDEITGNPIQLPKSSFSKTKNDHLDLEKFSMCTDCGRKLHNICVQHMDAIWPQGFTCENCLKTKGAKRKDNRFTAKRLPGCKLSVYLESRVNNYLKMKNIGAGEVVIRVLASGDKETEVKQGMRERFPNLPATYPYRTKAMFAFEEIDGQEVCFFGMHVQEYDDKGCQPNRGRVYISYLDSVHFFHPREHRTAVYHEILIGYLDYCKTLGFNWGHIWACPPSEGDDYIFHCHPTEQKIPKPKRLQDWYKKMLDKAIIQGVVVEYKDIYKDAVEKSIQCASDVPYFEGDFWPNVLEESIKELEQEEEEKRKREEEEAALAQDDEPDFIAEGEETSMDSATGSGKKQGKKAGQKKKGNKKAGTRKSGKKPAQPSGSDLSSKVMSAMEKYRDVFFVIKLQPHALIRQDPVLDPDPLIACDLMDGRDAFLTMAREKHWEFSTLRRTKYSTMAMLHEIHNSSRDAFVYTCNLCRGQVETRYHCTVCEDFDLCVPCYQKEKHKHPMERLGLDLDSDGSSDSAGMQTPAESRKISIQRCIQQLVHACQCRDANCRQASCSKMKKVVGHTRSCRKKSQGGCSVCKQLVTLCCVHAKSCNEGKCPVPFCQSIKQKLKQQQAAARKKQAHMLRRRMQAMITPSQNSASSTPPSVHSGAGGAAKLQHSNSQTSFAQVPSPYQSGKTMPAVAPPAAVSAAQHAMNAARKQTQGPPVVPIGGGGKPQMSTGPPPPHMQPNMGKPQQQPQQQQRSMNQVTPSMMQQQSSQSMSIMQPNGGGQMSQQGGYSQQMTQREPHPGMGPSHPSGGMMMPQGMPSHDQWGNPQQPPPPMYNPPGPGQQRAPQHNMQGHHPGMVQGGMGPLGSGQQPGGMGPGVGVPSAGVNIMRKLELALKSPSSPQQSQEIMEILKRNPALMDAYIKRKNQPGQGPHVPQPHQQSGGPHPHMPGQMPGQMRSEMWHHRRPQPMQPNIYQQQQNSGYPPQIGPRTPMMSMGMSPQYGAMGQPRYHGPGDNPSMSQAMSGHPQAMRGGGGPPGIHNQLLHQVRSPTSLPQHTRSPQPTQSPRQQIVGSVASPALMQSTDTANMGGMMQPGTPGAQHNFPSMNANMQQHPDYGDQQGYGVPQQQQPQQDNEEEINKFVDSL